MKWIFIIMIGFLISCNSVSPTEAENIIETVREEKVSVTLINWGSSYTYHIFVETFYVGIIHQGDSVFLKVNDGDLLEVKQYTHSKVSPRDKKIYARENLILNVAKDEGWL